jgi:hypothetical protein
MHGPSGELGIGAVDWRKLPRLILILCLPALLVPWIFHSWATAFFCLCGAVPLSVRLARLGGTQSVVDQYVTHWIKIFAAGAGALLVLSFVAAGSGIVLYTAAALAFLYATTIYFNSKKLLAWEPPPDKAAPLPDIPISNLVSLRAELEVARVSLISLPVFDDAKPDLLDAWEKRDPAKIATLLHEGNRQTQESWSRANALFNQGQAGIDRARAKLSALLMQAETQLKPLNLDYCAITIERSKFGYLEMSAAIPKDLTANRITFKNNMIAQGGSRAMVESIAGKLPFWGAVIAVASAVIAHFVLKSRTLRRLKDTQGQLTVNAKAVRGDCATVDTLLTTRVLPQLTGMIDVMSRIETALASLQSEVVDPSNSDQRDKALQMAFALVEGRSLVATAGGN